MAKFRWTAEMLLKHPNREFLLGLSKPTSAPPARKEQKAAAERLESKATISSWKTHRFVVPGSPMGKPRMTQRDVWKKRPVVLRYREYCDRIRAACGPCPENVYSVHVFSHFPVPDSWSKKKRADALDMPMQQRPDWDNVAKAVCDALFQEDSHLVGGVSWKFWCRPGEERTEICVLFWHVCK